MNLDNKKRVRFAPSPTGLLHPGNARIAVFNWLYAKHYGAELVLRIEDTDAERSTIDFENSIIADLKWLGLDWDIGPVRQSDRKARYTEVLNSLLEQGWLYPCYCSDEELDAERQAQLKSGKPPRYSAKCKNLTKKDAPYVLRFDVEKYASIKGSKIVEFKDLIKNKDGHSKLSSHISVIGDFVLVRRDGTPTYNFAVVVDDSDMGITQVFRGEDHISNTFRQLMLFDVLGKTAPEYGHLPMLLAKDRTKLSKRSGGLPVNEYRSMGILSDAVFNHLAFLGGIFGSADEQSSRQELIKAFDYKNTAVSASVYDMEKLYSINSKFVSKLSSKDLVTLMIGENIIGEEWKKLYNENAFERIVSISKEGVKTLKDILVVLDIFVSDNIDNSCFNDFDDEQKDLLEKITDSLVAGVALKQGWSAFKNEIKATTALSGAKFFKPLRFALTGRTWGPPLDDSVELINKDIIISRANKIKCLK